jgi:hypothetical protein
MRVEPASMSVEYARMRVESSQMRVEPTRLQCCAEYLFGSHAYINTYRVKIARMSVKISRRVPKSHA